MASVVKYGNPIGQGPKNLHRHAINQTLFLYVCIFYFSFFKNKWDVGMQLIGDRIPPKLSNKISFIIYLSSQ